MKLVVFAFFLALAAFGLAACGGGGSSPTVEVQLTNWAVKPSQSQLAAGNVTFKAIHPMEHQGMAMSSEGGATHELIVAAEDSAGSGTFGRVLLKLSDIKPGESKSGSVNLAPGTYELSCQVGEEVPGKLVAHYAKGMHTTITVS